MTEYKKWQTTASKYLVEDRWIKLRADTCVTPDGHTITPYYVLEYHRDWINCLAIDEENNVIAIRQYRHGVQEYVLEIVAGGTEAKDGGPANAARREMQEEIGYTGGELVQVGVSYANPANHTNKIYSFFAFGGSSSVGDQALEAGENIFIEKMPFVEFVKRVTDPKGTELTQSYFITNLLLTIQYIKASEDPRLQQLREIIKREL